MAQAQKRRRVVHGGGTPWTWIVILVAVAGLVLFLLMRDARRHRRPQDAPTATTIYRTVEPPPAPPAPRPTRTAAPSPSYPRGVPVTPPMQSHASPPTTARPTQSGAPARASRPSRPSRPAGAARPAGAGGGGDTQQEGDAGYGVPGYGRPLPRPSEYSPPGYGTPLKDAGRPTGY